MKIELDLPEIEGFEYTGDFREPSIGEFYQYKKDAVECVDERIREFAILKKKAPVYSVKTHRIKGEDIKHIEVKAVMCLLEIIDDLATNGDDFKVMREVRELIK